MNFIDIVTLIEEAYAELQKLKADGTYDKLIAAEKTIASEIQTPGVQSIVSKLKNIKL